MIAALLGTIRSWVSNGRRMSLFYPIRIAGILCLQGRNLISNNGGMEMKVLVTGGAGFIGSNYVLYMLNKYPSYQIINLDALTYAGNLENLQAVEKNPHYSFVKGNIRDKSVVEQTFQK